MHPVQQASKIYEPTMVLYVLRFLKHVAKEAYLMMRPSGITVYEKLRCHNRQQACVDYSSQYLSLTLPKTHILYGAITKHLCWRTLSINFNNNLPPTICLQMR